MVLQAPVRSIRREMHCVGEAMGMVRLEQTGTNNTTDSLVPIQVLAPDGINPFSEAAIIEVSGQHSCIIKADSTVWCVGNNSDGKLGDGTTASRLLPVQVRGYGTQALLDVQNVGLAVTFSCALTLSGKIFCWGSNAGGECADGTFTSPRTTPVPVIGQGE